MCCAFYDTNHLLRNSTMPKRKIEGIVAYYSFWGWEYLRRNSEYIADNKKFYEMIDRFSIEGFFEVNRMNSKIKDKKQEVPDLLKAELDFLKKYNRKPTDPNKGISSEELLVEMEKAWDGGKIFDGLELYKMLRQGDRFNYFEGSTIAYRQGKGTNVPSYSEKDLGIIRSIGMLIGEWSPSSKLMIEIDLNDDINLILREVKYSYYRSIRENLGNYPGGYNIDDSIPKKDSKFRITDESIEIFGELHPSIQELDPSEDSKELTEEQRAREKEFLAWMDREEWWWDKIKARQKYPIKSRAYGLWLWDYIETNKCKPAQAIRALAKRNAKEEKRFEENRESLRNKIEKHNSKAEEHNRKLRERKLDENTYKKRAMKKKILYTNTDEARYHIDVSDPDNIKRLNTCLRKAGECINQRQVLTMK